MTEELPTETMALNVGPAHPATHGALRFFVELDGETITRAATEIGYLHRAFEKHSEHSTWSQVIPYTDRLNYCSSLLNNVGYCFAIEKLLGVDIPERAKFIRVIVSELARIMDHLICVGTSAVDLGGLTNFWYFFNVREKIYDFTEKLCGARLTTNYTRIGGVMRDLSPDFTDGIRGVLKDLDRAIRDVTRLLERNRIFMDRTQGVGVISKEDALNWGFTGPCLRASGVPYDVRKAEPYYYYDTYDFEIPIGTAGDTYDRLMLRVEEMRQSAKIILQALERIPEGPVLSDDPRIALPPKERVYGSIEGLMNHFMLLIDGIKPPKGEVYGAIEAANGELGFYIVSDGEQRPYRVHCRPPCFPLCSAFVKMVEGGMIADAIAVLGSLNIVVGELDR
jgi:NADH dehydrogenase I D subunit